MSYVPELDIRVKSYDPSNFSRACVVQFWASWYIIMSPKRTSVWKVISIRISRELPLFNFQHLDVLYPRIGHPCEKVWPFKFLDSFHCSILSVWMSYVSESDICVKIYNHLNFSRAFVVQFRASRYIISPNRTSVLKVMTILISRNLPFFNFEHLDILCPKIEHHCEKLWPFDLLESFHCWTSSVLIYYVPESDICVKSYDRSIFSRASVVQFRASRWVTSPNRTFVWKVIATRIYREASLFNFERLEILCPKIGHPCEMLWPFEFLESFRSSISSVSISYFHESNIRVKSYDHFNFSNSSVFQFRASRYIMS